jgi:hypothetical protein
MTTIDTNKYDDQVPFEERAWYAPIIWFIFLFLLFVGAVKFIECLFF